MVKGGTNVMNDFNLGLLLSGYENGGLLCKREIQKYMSVKSKIVAANARLPVFGIRIITLIIHVRRE